MSDELVPNHVAIIMDGNGRWAKQRNLPRTAGHREGVQAAQEIIKASGEAGVRYLTLFAFSSENWKRPKAEVSALMELFLRSLKNEVRNLSDNGVRLKFLGDTEYLSKKLHQQIEMSERMTCDNDKLFLNIAVNYGGKWDILEATKKLVKEVQDGKLAISEIENHMLEVNLATENMPSPDLFIRTGGEQRISNFLLWQLAYTELYFCEALWPDFSPQELKKAFDSFSSRQRRYGQTQEQVSV
jgi:undecaprenyl diphosphate synthase